MVKSKAAASETGETGETAGGRNGCGSDGLSDAAAVTGVMGCRASAMIGTTICAAQIGMQLECKWMVLCMKDLDEYWELGGGDGCVI